MLKNKFQDYFGRMKLQRRLMSYFIVICIIPLIIIGSTSIFISMNSTRNSAIEFSDATLLQIKTRIETIMDKAETISLQLADDITIQKTLRRPLSNDLARQYETDLAMDTYLNYELTYTKDIYGFYIIGENKAKYKSAYNSFYKNDLTTTLWYQTIIDAQHPVWFSTHRNSQAVQTSSQFFISRGMKIQDKASNKNLGVILIDIELKEIEQILVDSFGDLGQVIVIDEKNKIVASSNNIYDSESDVIQEAITLTDFKNNPNTTSSTRNNILLSHYLTYDDWRVVAIIPSDLLLEDSLISVILFLILLILISALSFYISKIIISTITKPVHNMISLMKEVEGGNLDVKTTVDYNDEIGDLSKSFNTMTLQVKTLMETSVEEQRTLRKYELKALQAQINPHFLYNTLDSVLWLARKDNTQDIIHIVSAMTKLFRVGLSRGKDIITIEDEIDHVKNYLLIQKFRYRKRFEYTIDIPDHLYHFKTLKLILQPLVENAIYHGIKLQKDNGTITIKAIDLEDSIVFKVEDTGLGMTEDTLANIHNAFDTKDESNITMYGIKNVNERIEIFFGKQYGLRYESEYKKGTVATITIPKYLGDDINVKNNNY